MKVSQDLRSPVAVAVGYWNQAILNQPGWIAEHILGIAPGTEIDTQEIVIPGPSGTLRRIFMLGPIGISCTQQRLEFYLPRHGTPDSVHDAIAKLSEKLPHTPVSAVGINFNYTIDEDVAALVSKFETGDLLDAFGVLKSSERSDTLQLAEDEAVDITSLGCPLPLLTVHRKTDFNSVSFSFNFHQDLSNMKSLGTWALRSPVIHYQRTVKNLLSGVYDIEEHEIITF